MASNEGYVKHRRWKLESLGRLPLQTLNQLVRDNLSTDPSIRMWRRNTSKLKKLEDKVISWPTNCCRIFLGNKKEEVLERPGETSPAHAAVTRTTAPVLGHIIIRKSRNKWVTKYSFFRPGLGTANLSRSLNWDVLSVQCRSESARHTGTSDRRDM